MLYCTYFFAPSLCTICSSFSPSCYTSFRRFPCFTILLALLSYYLSLCRFLSHSSLWYLCAITLYISQLNLSLFGIHYYAYVMSIQKTNEPPELWGRTGPTREYAVAGISSELACISYSLGSASSSTMPKRARIHYVSLRSSLVNLPISIYGPLVERNGVSKVRSRSQKPLLTGSC